MIDPRRRWSARHSLRRPARAAACLALTAAIGCPKVPTQTAMMREEPNVDLSSATLQTRAFETGRRFNGRIELAADSIMRVSDSATVRVRALHWKVDAIPLVQEASLRNDPLVATVDLAVFSIQQEQYFRSGDGREAFGAQQPIAVAAAKAVEDDAFSTIDESVKGGSLSPVARERITTWATSHPMRGATMQRESVLASRWDAIGVGPTTIAATAGNIDRTLQQLSLRVSFLNETLSQQLRWNTQLMLEEALRAPRGDSMMAGGADVLRNVNALAVGAPALIARERAAILAGVDRERALALADVDRQRRETLQFAAEQRIALQAALDAQRVAAFADIDRERIAVMKSADSLAAGTIARADAMARRIMIELLVVALVTVAALTIGALIVVHRWRATA